MLNEVEIILEKLFNYYNVSNVAELSKIIDTDPKRISNWKTRNSINAAKKRIRELGIYNEIFGDSNINNIDNTTINGDASSVIDNSMKKRVIKNSSVNIPSDIVSDLNNLFELASKDEEKLKTLIENIDDFVYAQKKSLR